MKLDIGDGNLHVNLNPLEKILSLHGSLELPLDHVTGVSASKPTNNRSIVRAPGTHIPGLLKAGTYHGHGRQFWYTTIGKPYLVIDLTKWEYERVVITIGDNGGWAQRIEQARN